MNEKNLQGLSDMPQGLQALMRSNVTKRKLPPVDNWEPPYCGDLDMRIARDGTWFYNGTPIGREALVSLFATVLRKDEDGKTYLVTPVEKIGITVDDAAFLAIEMFTTGSGENQIITFVTKQNDLTEVSEVRPLRFELEQDTDGVKPYVLVRGRLEACLTRALTYDLVSLGQSHNVDGEEYFGVWSNKIFWSMCKTADFETGHTDCA